MSVLPQHPPLFLHRPPAAPSVRSRAHRAATCTDAGPRACPPSSARACACRRSPATTAYANLDHAASTPALVDGQGGRRPRARDLLLGAPRRWLRLAADERLVRAGPRRGRRVRRARAATTRSSSPARRPTRGRCSPGAAEPHDGLRLRAPSTTRPCCPGAAPAPCGSPCPQSVEDAVLAARGGAGPRRRTRRGTDSSSSPPPPTSPARCGRSSDFAADRPRARCPDRRRRRPAVGAPHASTSPRWDADYVAFSGHKTYAPFGAGRARRPRGLARRRHPLPRGGGATRAVTEHGTSWATGPARHEGGSPNVVGAIALAAACATIARPPRGDRGARGAPAGPAARRSRGDRRRRACSRSSATTTTASAWWPSPSTGSTPRSSRRSCPSSTASACGTASSAPTCSSTSCSRTRGASHAGRARLPCAPASGSARPSRPSSASSVRSPSSSKPDPRPGGPRGDTGWVVAGIDPRDVEVTAPLVTAGAIERPGSE